MKIFSTWGWRGVVSSLRKSSLPLVCSQTNSHHPFRESVALSEHEREQMSLSTYHALRWERPALLSVCLTLLSLDGCYEAVCRWWSQPYIEHVFLHLSQDVPGCYQSYLVPLPKQFCHSIISDFMQWIWKLKLTFWINISADNPL